MKKLLLVTLCFSSLFSSAQSGSEIYLFDLSVKDGQVIISGGKNITNHKGYDNQPFFHPSQPLIYYSSFNDSGRSDIKYFNYETKETKNFTETHEREYSPAVTPDGKFISCILQRDNGVQDLVKYPIEGGKPQLLIFHLKVGYHAWAGENKLLLYVLDDSINNSLHYYYLDKNADTVIAENIGRSLHKIPGQNAMSFVQKISDKLSMIKKFDMSMGVISTIVATLPGQDHLTWLQNGLLLSSDGTKFFICADKNETSWQPVIVEGETKMLKGVTRLAVNADNSKLAVVVSE
jgi:WD40 repeat protein